jgi:hypothetical protein
VPVEEKQLMHFFTLRLPHFGQAAGFLSLEDTIFSNWQSHFSQRYSYIGILNSYIIIQLADNYVCKH